MNLLNIQRFFLCVLVSIMFIPYVASFMGVGEGLLYAVEIIAIVFWYVASLTIPLIIREFDTTLVLWCFTFILVCIVIGSDLVYHMTGITPLSWYDGLGRLMPSYYSFMKTWALIITPGCVLFFVVLFNQKVHGKLKGKT